jgi:hypothetical protein
VDALGHRLGAGGFDRW